MKGKNDLVKWTADKIERRPIANLIPYARNAPTHSPEHIDQIAVFIREFGSTNSVLLDASYHAWKFL
jgi:hypothetical protein